MKFKYQEYIKELSIECPPSSYEPKEMQAFRFVFEASHQKAKNNFLPVLIINPSRQFNKSNDKCKGYALSLFDTKENLEKRYLTLKQSFPNISETLGDQIAEGFIAKTDGLASKIDTRGHFSLHEFENTDLVNKFNITSSLE